MVVAGRSGNASPPHMKPTSLSLLALVAVLSTGCNKSNRQPPPVVPAPDNRLQPITEFRAADWTLAAKDGAEQPRSDSGRLRLESINPTGPAPAASIVSKVTGQFSDFSAKLAMARPSTPTEPVDYEAFLTLGIVGTTEATASNQASAVGQANKVANTARIGLRAIGTSLELVAQVLDATGNPLEQRTKPFGGIDDGDGNGSSVPTANVRIELDEKEQIIRFKKDSELLFTYVPTTLTLPENSTIGVVAEGRKFLVLVDEFLAVDVDSATPSFSFEGSQIPPEATFPGRVRFLFSLKDQTGAPLNLPANDLVGDNLFFRENDQPIDRSESNPIFKRANVPQDVVIVLDYSESLRSQGGTAAMVQGAKNLADGVWGLNPTNRVQFWEFHDSFTIATVIIDQPPSNPQGDWLTSADRTAAFQALDAFAPYNGFSRVFDAVEEASTSFQQAPRVAVRSIAFLTDGFDTGSLNSADDLISLANSGPYALYPIAVGAPEPQLRELRRIAANTGGMVYPVPDVTKLVDVFGDLGGDLGSLYSASYVSSRQTYSGSTEVSLNVDLLLAGATERQRLPVPVKATLFIPTGDTRVGSLDIKQTSFVGNTATLLARATFVPRLVDEFSLGSFELRQGFPGSTTPITPAPSVTVTVRRAGNGLLAAWNEFAVQPSQFQKASGPALQFGDFGDFVEITITGIPATPPLITLRGVIQNTDLAPVRFITQTGGAVGTTPNWQFDVALVRPPTTP